MAAFGRSYKHIRAISNGRTSVHIAIMSDHSCIWVDIMSTYVTKLHLPAGYTVPHTQH